LITGRAEQDERNQSDSVTLFAKTVKPPPHRPEQPSVAQQPAPATSRRRTAPGEESENAIIRNKERRSPNKSQNSGYQGR
jgi:hypothetical protein